MHASAIDRPNPRTRHCRRPTILHAAALALAITLAGPSAAAAQDRISDGLTGSVQIAHSWLLLFEATLLLIGFFPFTRLVHVLVVPNPYLWRRTQVVIWNWDRSRLRKVD